MRRHRFSMSILFLGILLTILTVWLGGCASPPSERPDREKIKQNAEKGMQDLKREEDRERDDY
ncbi:MAG: hypothetical protein HY349_08085 [Nitrospirae bacterium]|nr:hypothetical protein [Nitrospirota bacterium]